MSRRRRRRDVVRLLTTRGGRVEVSVCAFCACLVVAEHLGHHWRVAHASRGDQDGG